VSILQALFSTEIFLPRGDEYLWTPRLLGLELGSNLLLAMAGLAIATGFARRVVARRAALSRRTQIGLGLCAGLWATTHAFDLWVIWAPLYWLDALVRTAAAIVATATAIALFTDRGDR
jgi:hypothetical protein